MTNDPNQPRVGFIGAGRMATALATGMVESGFTTSDRVIAADVVPEACDRFATDTGSRIAGSNTDVLDQADIVVLAVKPQYMQIVLQDIKDHVTADHIVVSIAAGVSLDAITVTLGTAVRLIRVMPNTPCLVGAGAACFATGGGASDDDAALVGRLLETVGIGFRVPEHLLDAVTGLSGSGPAFVYQCIEAMSDGGVAAGLPRELATQLAAQTVMGAAQMVLQTREHPGVLKDAVASPGGTTIAGLHELERGGLRASLMNAVVAAATRAGELGNS
jgi:pyrroline-5-carboxylate reductase